MEQIEVGDVVKLASGGPYMTVLTVSEMHGLECAWFSQWHTTTGEKEAQLVVNWSDTRQNAHFPLESLVLVKKRKTEKE